MALDRPNILWIMTDEQCTDSLGCYGSHVAHTPNIDAMARQGVVFVNAVTSTPVCVPVRTNVLTGSYPVDTGVWWNHQPRRHLDYLTQLLAEGGYQTASFGKQPYGAPILLADHNGRFELRSKLCRVTPLCKYGFKF